MVLTSYNANYYCTCGGAQQLGQKVHIITTTTQAAAPAAGAAASSSQDLWQKFYDGVSGVKPSPIPERQVSEETQTRVLQLEKLHRETVREKEDTIASLRDVIVQHERRVLELESQTDENISARKQSGIIGRARISPTQQLLTQIERLQNEKEALLRKVSDLQRRQAGRTPSVDYGLKPDSPELSSQVGPCSTDTEKELHKMKRDRFFLDREISKLRRENAQLRDQLSQLGVDFADVPEGFSLISKSDDPCIGDISNPSLPTSRHDSEETIHDRLCDSGYLDSVSISSLDGQIHALQIELEQKSEELRLAQSRNDPVETARLKAVVHKLHQLVVQVYGEFQELKKSYMALREEMKHGPAALKDVISQMYTQVQRQLAEINSRHQEVVEKYLKEMKLRKKYHNELVELRGNIRVFCRVRPWIKEDGRDEDEIVVTPDLSDDSLIQVNNKGRNQQFDMDKVFSMESTQEQIFEEVSSLVRSVIDGFNVCIFAYGQTGSGKTYTMEGPVQDPGINQRALQLLFEETGDSNWQYQITASVMEIYNEVIRDLLNSDPTNKLEVKMKPEGGLHVPGLVQVPVSSLTEVNQIFETGRRNRATASTNMNEHSSRSHCLLCVQVVGFNPTTGSKSMGRLNLVDLAGSERVSKSQAGGQQLKEAQSINKSLACLGDVIHALRNKHGHVPYRNSKLTYLLQDSLGGDSKTLMIVQVAPVEKNVSETVCTLSFGQRVRAVELGAATKHVDGVKTPKTNKRPSNLVLSSAVSSAASSPSSSPSSSARSSPVMPSTPTPFFNGRRTLSSSSSLSSINSPTTPNSSRRSPLISRAATSPTVAAPTQRKLPPTPKTPQAPTSPLISRTNGMRQLNKSATVPNSLSKKVKA